MSNNWPDFPISVYEATGGLIGDSVIICGGWGEIFIPGWGNVYNPVNECYSMTSEKATIVTQMSVGRSSAASIVINDNTLWITGGSGSNSELLASTEYVTLTETMPGPTMPIGLLNHAIVAINSTFSMVIGGLDENRIQTLMMTGNLQTISTYFYDHNEEEWITGPSLMNARESHAAGMVTDEVTSEHFVVVTGGKDSSFYLDSTEILQDGEWVQGKINNTICRLLKNLLVA